MRFADAGYAVFRDDETREISFNEYRNYLENEGRNEFLNGVDPSEYPYKIEVEFGDNNFVSTTVNDYGVSRIFRVGDAVYGASGVFQSFNLKLEYSMHYYFDDGDIKGDVFDYGAGYMIEFPLTVEADQAYGKYLEENDDDLEISYFDSLSSRGLGKSAFSSSEVSVFFQEEWYLNPFGNDFNGSKSSVYRLFNQNSGRYLFSSNQVEIDIITGMDWINEGIAYKSPDSDQETTALHRFNTNGNGHFYTANESEKEILESTTSWTYEGIAFQVYSHEQAGSVTSAIPVIRYLNTNSGVHLYSTSSIEQEILNTAPEWLYEGIAWYGTSI